MECAVHAKCSLLATIHLGANRTGEYPRPMLRFRFLSMAMFVLLATIPAAQAQQCKQLDSATPDEWASYLNQAREDQTTEPVPRNRGAGIASCEGFAS